MLKRTNIHFKKENLTELDEIVQLINDEFDKTNSQLSVTRADLIRFAIARTFGLGFSAVHIQKEELWNIIRYVKGNPPE